MYIVDFLKEGDIIEFYLHSSPDRKKLRGGVKEIPELGLITIINKKRYEIRKLIDIKVVNRSINFPTN